MTESSVTPEQSLCFWSTPETVRRGIPSVAAMIETTLSVGLYCWIALQAGLVTPLLISAAVAPFVLLRSEQSIATGVRWLEAYGVALQRDDPSYAELSLFNKTVMVGHILVSVLLGSFLTEKVVRLIAIESKAADMLLLSVVAVFFSFVFFYILGMLLRSVFPGVNFILSKYFVIAPKWLNYTMVTIGMPLTLLMVSLTIRIGATLMHLGVGLRAMPKNFRVLVLCMSPSQVPELVPGIPLESEFHWDGMRKGLREAVNIPALSSVMLAAVAIIAYGPAWLYRITIKSTAWFWWPLAFLGGDLSGSQNLAMLHWKIAGSLWAKATIIGSCLTLGAFLVINFVGEGVIFKTNPLLTPLGYLLLIDWTPRLWQISALAVSVLSLALVFRLNYISGEYRIASEAHDNRAVQTVERKFDRLQRLARFRLLLAGLFWFLVAAQALLYVNGQRCWFVLPPEVEDLARTIYGARLPPSACSN